MGTWVGLFLSLQNKGVLSIARGRSPGRKRCEDVTWVLGWETAQACFFHSAPCGGIQTSHMNTAHCWNQGRILNAHEKRVQIASRPPRHGIQEAVSPGRVWSDACGGETLGHILLGGELCPLVALVLRNYSVGWIFPHFWWDWKRTPL